jgi:hypothetical protein
LFLESRLISPYYKYRASLDHQPDMKGPQVEARLFEKSHKGLDTRPHVTSNALFPFIYVLYFIGCLCILTVVPIGYIIYLYWRNAIQTF